MPDTTDQLAKALVEKLDADAKLDLDSKILVYAAFEGEAALEAAVQIGGTFPSTDEFVDAGEVPDPVGAYLKQVTVSGFRGVGPQRSLDLKPGPGLTVVCGRNGSGKSSFAEAIEFALTGHNERWAEDRSTEWRDGWRNLHHKHPSLLEVHLLVEGRSPAETVVRRRWPQGGDLKSGTTDVQSVGESPEPLTTLGWDQPLEMFRPFLTYNELGDALTGRPSALHDALWKILGLERITATQTRLNDVVKKLKDAVEAAKSQAAQLSLQARALAGDERADTLVVLLGKRSWDLAAIEAIAHDDETDEGSSLGVLRQLAGLSGSDLEAVGAATEALRTAVRRVEDVQGTDADRCALDAGLLEHAVTHHASTGDGACPVCGNGTIDASWHAAAEARIAELRERAQQALSARSGLTAATAQAQRLITTRPPAVAQIAEVGLAVAVDLFTMWQRYAEAPSDPVQLAAHLEEHAPGLVAAVREVAAAAASELARRRNVWRPVAHAVQAWLVTARQVQHDAATLSAVTKASNWVKAAATDWANTRLAPLSEQSTQIWEQLRQESNVALGPVRLEGTGNRRRVRLDVAVDGADGSALGIMSQGELHALALSLFLPRATVPASPFRFLVIDDPVQAMDPAKVDGLAQVLADVAERRQVIVFTHDDRLPAAIRRLKLRATILEVTRRQGSVVDVVASEDPALRYLHDAAGLIKDPAVDPTVASRVVPGLCRLAIDAVCVDTIRAHRLAKGATHAEVESLIEDNPKLYPRMALALFGDETRTGHVLQRLNQYGVSAAGVFKSCNKGAHDGASTEQLSGMVADARNLVKRLQS